MSYLLSVSSHLSMWSAFALFCLKLSRMGPTNENHTQTLEKGSTGKELLMGPIHVLTMVSFINFFSAQSIFSI